MLAQNMGYSECYYEFMVEYLFFFTTESMVHDRQLGR